MVRDPESPEERGIARADRLYRVRYRFTGRRLDSLIRPLRPTLPVASPFKPAGDVLVTASSESLLGVLDLAGLGTADQGSTSPKPPPGFGVLCASGSTVVDGFEDKKAEEDNGPPIRRGALNISGV
jgi:hypothetical protein